MKLIALTAETTGLTGFTHKLVLEGTDVAAMAGATGSLQVLPPGTGTVPAGSLVYRAAMNLQTPFVFSDGTMNSLLVEVGDGGTSNRFIASTQVAAAGTSVTFAAQAAATTPHVYNTADGIDVKLTCAGGAGPLLNKCTAGKLEIYLGICDLNDMELCR